VEIFKLLVYAGENYGIGTLSLSATSLALEKMNEITDGPTSSGWSRIDVHCTLSQLDYLAKVRGSSKVAIPNLEQATWFGYY